MEVLLLQNVESFVVFDLDDAPHNAGGTRLAPDVTEAEGALLARAMTYKFAVLGHPLGGAKGLVRANADRRETAMARYCDEIRPLVAARRFATGPDLGTYEADFTSLRPANWEPHVVNSVVDGVAFEDVLTGFGVAVAADVALGGLDDRTVALEGFGKVGAGVAREITRRGGRVVAISTVAGCVTDPAGLDLDELWEARTAHGDQLVSELRRTCLPREALFEVDADVLVPGARVGVLDERRAARVAARAVVPAANVPYTAAGLAALGSRGIAAHADFRVQRGRRRRVHVTRKRVATGRSRPGGGDDRRARARLRRRHRRTIRCWKRNGRAVPPDLAVAGCIATGAAAGVTGGPDGGTVTTRFSVGPRRRPIDERRL